MAVSSVPVQKLKSTWKYRACHRYRRFSAYGYTFTHVGEGQVGGNKQKSTWKYRACGTTDEEFSYIDLSRLIDLKRRIRNRNS